MLSFNIQFNNKTYECICNCIPFPYMPQESQPTTAPSHKLLAPVRHTTALSICRYHEYQEEITVAHEPRTRQDHYASTQAEGPTCLASCKPFELFELSTAASNESFSLFFKLFLDVLTWGLRKMPQEDSRSSPTDSRRTSEARQGLLLSLLRPGLSSALTR